MTYIGTGPGCQVGAVQLNPNDQYRIAAPPNVPAMTMTSTPNINIAATDPFMNLLNENGRLMRENLELRTSVERVQKEGIVRAMPDWVWDPLNYGFSNMGRLFVRLQHWVKNQPFLGGDPQARMSMGQVEIYEAIEVVKDGQPKMALFTRVGKEALVVYDSLELFPSDELLTKLLTLADAKDK